MVSNFEACKAMANTRARKLANNTTLVCNADGSYSVRLHSTDIVTFYYNGDMSLHTGGWRTTTTKQRINAALADTKWIVFQKDFVWYLRSVRDESTIAFWDGMTLFNGCDLMPAKEGA